MSYRQITIRLDLAKEREREVWEYLHRRGAASTKRELMELVMRRMDADAMCEAVRRTLEESLRSLPVAGAAASEEASAEDELMDFLEAF